MQYNLEGSAGVEKKSTLGETQRVAWAIPGTLLKASTSGVLPNWFLTRPAQYGVSP